MIEPYDVARRLGLDARGGMYRSDDGLSDARRSHPTSYGRGLSHRGTSIEDVREVQRYFAVQGMGLEGPRPSVRPRRRGTDTEAEVGHAQGKPMTDLRHVAGAHRESAMFVYQRHGRLHPKLWVESDTQIVLIEPSSWGACDVSDYVRAEMLHACIRSVDAAVIGRCDEVYIRDATKKRDRMLTDDLASMVDVDPSIRSALMVHAFDMRSHETYMTMATFDLDNEGLPFWERHEMESAYDVLAVPLWAAAKMMVRKPQYPLSAFEADDFVNERFWITTRLDK